MNAIAHEIVQATEEESVMQARPTGALPRWFPVPGIRFEVPEGGEGGGATAVADPPEPEPVEAVADPPDPQPPAAEPEFAQIPRQEYDELRAGMGMLRSLGELIETERENLFTEPEPEDPASQLPPLPEPFDPQYAEKMQAYLDARDERTRDAAIAPYAPLLQNTARQQGESFTTEVFDKLEGEVGTFDRKLATRTAAFLVRGGEDPDRALAIAAHEHAGYEKRIREDAVAQHVARATALGELPNEPPAGPGSAEVTAQVPTGPRRYETQLERSMARQEPET